LTIRPGRRVVPVRKCQYEKCRSTRASLVNIDGKHERDLCPDHAEGLRDIWQHRRAAYRVSWGISSDERIALDRARIAALVNAFGEPDPEQMAKTERARYAWWDDLDTDLETEPPVYEPSMQEQAWDEIESLRWRIDDIETSNPRRATVRVTPRTEEDPPRRF
jgi:hypothetical protein